MRHPGGPGPGMRTAMQAYLAKNYQVSGPFPQEHILDLARSGQLDDQYTALPEGTTEWVPLEQFLGVPLAQLAGSPLPPENRVYTRAGYGSLMVGGLGAVAWLVIMMAAGLAVKQGANNQSPTMVMYGLMMFVMLALNVAGLIAGLSALSPQTRHRWTGAVGLLLCGGQIVLFVVLLLLGLTVRKAGQPNWPANTTLTRIAPPPQPVATGVYIPPGAC